MTENSEPLIGIAEILLLFVSSVITIRIVCPLLYSHFSSYDKKLKRGWQVLGARK